jgi:hypothetical protein
MVPSTRAACVESWLDSYLMTTGMLYNYLSSPCLILGKSQILYQSYQLPVHVQKDLGGCNTASSKRLQGGDNS